jgi:iron complex outermembrane recepter protein
MFRLRCCQNPIVYKCNGIQVVIPLLNSINVWRSMICSCLICLQTAWADEERPSSDVSKQPSSTSIVVQKNKPTPHVDHSKQLKLPQLLKSVEAIYPPEALAKRKKAQVDLLVTVLEDGSVGPVVVEQSSDSDFNEAAISAVQQWKFEPAREGGTAIACRLRIPFSFTIQKETEDQDSGQPISANSDQDEAYIVKPKDHVDHEGHELNADLDHEISTKIEENEPMVMTIHGHNDQYLLQRSSSDFFIGRDVLIAAPHQEGAEVLRTAPGLYIGRARGPAIAHSYMLRGFDSEHGQDIAFSVGGIPINIPSHIHGQGYSDLGFLISDVVHGLEVTEGVHKPQQGDFAVAGSIDISLGVEKLEKGLHLSMTQGSWNTRKFKGVWAPKESPKETFGAFEVTTTDGFGENRMGTGGSGIFQHQFGQGQFKHRLLAILHLARSNFAGVLRNDDVNSGEVCFTCVYPYATAQAQNALANRLILGFFTDYKTKGSERGQIGLWLSYDNFRLQNNFSGFQEASRTLEREAGRGDLIEQQNKTTSLGIKSRYRNSVSKQKWLRISAEVGADGRVDLIDQTQSLLDASVRNQTWDQRVDSSINAVDLGGWGDIKWVFNEYATLRTGLRVDALSYEINDRLGNFVPLTRPQDSFITGFRRSALGLAWGPRTSIEVKPLSWWSVFASYGEGYRSPQARLLEDGEETPFTKVKSADFGTRFDWGAPLRIVLGGYHTHLSDDVAFDASEGRLERIGATQRRGVFTHIHTHPFPWLLGSISATFVDAELLGPPPASAEEPYPAFTKGQQLPFVPPLVIRADIGTHCVLVDQLGQYPLESRFGLGFSYLSPRPLPYNEFADPVSLLDLSVSIEWGLLDLSFELYNVFNSQYAAVEYSFPSDWDPNDGLRPRTPMRHTAAGAPLSWMLSLGVSL